MLKRVQEILGVGQLRSDQDLAKAVESRLGRAAIDGLLRWGLTDDEVYLLIVPRRTLTHRRARDRIAQYAWRGSSRWPSASSASASAHGAGCDRRSGGSTAAARSLLYSIDEGMAA